MIGVLFTGLLCEIGAREKAVFQIIRSMLKFMLYAAMVYISLDCLGVNTRALIASMGIISVALSLGSKDLVSDILAGLGIIFDGAFRTGDFIEVNNFTGIVEEIGIRSTKIRNVATNNFMIINNHDIKNVVNHSKQNPKIRIELDIPIIVPMETIDAWFSRELPLIKEEIPEILDELSYYITNIGHFYVTVTVRTECPNSDYGTVRRNLIRKLKERLDDILRPYAEKLSDLSLKIE